MKRIFEWIEEKFMPIPSDIQFRDASGHPCELVRREFVCNTKPGAVEVCIGGTDCRITLPPGTYIVHTLPKERES